MPSATSMRRMYPKKALRAIFRRTYRCAEAYNYEKFWEVLEPFYKRVLTRRRQKLIVNLG